VGISVSVAPIELATYAFSQTIALNNAGAMHMERGDYLSSIKALTGSFLSFKKTYSEQKSCLLSLRTLIQESKRHVCHASNRNIDSSCSSATMALEAMIFNVGELFSWRRRSKTKRVHYSGSTSSEISSPRDRLLIPDNMNCADIDNHPPFFRSYRRIANTNQAMDDDCNEGDSAASVATSDVAMEDEEECCNEQDGASVYSNPIRLPPDFPITQESCGFLSTTITLNLALANHLYGLELLERQQHHPAPSPVLSSMIHQHLTSASRYYEYTIRLERARQKEEQCRMAAAAPFSQSHQPPASSSSLLPPLFVSPFALLVVLNNMGQLHVALSNKDRSQRCYRQLQSTLMFLLLHSSKGTNNSKEFAVFIENAALGLQNSSSRFMAAAA
jgi:hypothetical protein